LPRRLGVCVGGGVGVFVRGWDLVLVVNLADVSLQEVVLGKLLFAVVELAREDGHVAFAVHGEEMALKVAVVVVVSVIDFGACFCEIREKIISERAEKRKLWRKLMVSFLRKLTDREKAKAIGELMVKIEM
jgi:hypothetical protein